MQYFRKLRLEPGTFACRHDGDADSGGIRGEISYFGGRLRGSHLRARSSVPGFLHSPHYTLSGKGTERVTENRGTRWSALRNVRFLPFSRALSTGNPVWKGMAGQQQYLSSAHPRTRRPNPRTVCQDGRSSRSRSRARPKARFFRTEIRSASARRTAQKIGCRRTPASGE